MRITSKLVKGNRKYPDNLKRKVAQDYLSGKFSYSMGAELYGLPSKDVVKEFLEEEIIVQSVKAIRSKIKRIGGHKLFHRLQMEEFYPK